MPVSAQAMPVLMDTMIRTQAFAWVLAWVLVALAPCAQAVEDERTPEPTWKSTVNKSPSKSPTTRKRVATLQTPRKAHSARSKDFMVVSANPHATDAAVHIIKQGGTAADAAIATQLVLGLVEPQSSGLGGGGFALYWDASKTNLHSYDGRETAPSSIDKNHYLNSAGARMGYWDAVIGGHSVGVPGVPALLAKLHAKHGRLPWARLFEPAIALAEKGFPVSERLRLLLEHVTKIRDHPHTRAYFFNNGALPEVGYILRNPAYARTLRQLQKRGGRAFYRGKIAKSVVSAVRGDPMRKGALSMKDMRNYRIVENKPLCGPYRNYILCGPPPPSSGGISVLITLGILQHWDTRSLAAEHPQRIHLFAEALRRAFAERNVWVADPAAMPVAPTTLVDPRYLRRRSAEISLEHATASVSSGDFNQRAPANAHSKEPPSTSHISIVDRWNNIISMTTSIEGAFGSRIMVGGFLLNNQLSDFSFMPSNQHGAAILNRPGANKKPRSSMSPFIVFQRENMRPRLVIGSPGGSRIIPYVAHSIWLYLDAGLSLNESLELGRVAHLNKGVLELEQQRYAPQVIQALGALGHTVAEKRHGSGIHAIAVEPQGTMIGVADPRREGTAAGH